MWYVLSLLCLWPCLAFAQAPVSSDPVQQLAQCQAQLRTFARQLDHALQDAALLDQEQARLKQELEKLQKEKAVPPPSPKPE